MDQLEPLLSPPIRTPGRYHILDLGDLRLPDGGEEDQEAEERRRKRLTFAWEMLTREVAPPAVNRRRVKVRADTEAPPPPHGGEL